MTTTPSAPPQTRSKSRRPLALIGLATLLIGTGSLAWRSTTLRDIPEIGDPFDVAAFAKIEVRDEDNAFVPFREAVGRYKASEHANATDWALATESDRRWLEENREALAIWRRGADRPDALLIRPSEASIETSYDVVQSLRSFVRLACLEASRLAAAGDQAGAWGWYRAALRSGRLCGRNGGLIERMIGVAMTATASKEVTAWASLPQVDATVLRGALADVQGLDALTMPTSFTLVADSLAFFNSIERPDLLRKAMGGALTDEKGSEWSEWSAPKVAIYRINATLRREPERSRRVLRLILANWLPYCDLPADRRPPLASPHQLVFVTGPGSPPDARLLDPERINAAMRSTVLLRHYYPAYHTTLGVVDRDRIVRANLVVHLASELYTRERGKPPATPEALVGPYLVELPPGFDKK